MSGRILVWAFPNIGLNVRVSKTIEVGDGSVTFDGELSSEELDLVLTAGLSYLFMRGALPFQVINKKDKANIVHNESEAQN